MILRRHENQNPKIFALDMSKWVVLMYSHKNLLTSLILSSIIKYKIINIQWCAEQQLYGVYIWMIIWVYNILGLYVSICPTEENTEYKKFQFYARRKCSTLAYTRKFEVQLLNIFFSWMYATNIIELVKFNYIYMCNVSNK